MGLFDFRGLNPFNDFLTDFQELENQLQKLGYKPFNLNLKTKHESGIDENGEWTKTTYKSEDGNFKAITISRIYDDNENKKLKSNDSKFLEKELTKAIETQNFEFAVKLRDKINSLKDNSNKLKHLEEELKKSIEKQDFENCIKLRNEINKLK